MTAKFSAELVRGSLDMLILSVLADGPKYGYLIQKQIREGTQNAVSLQAGTLYPLLHRLEDEGLIRARWDDSTSRQRKWYELAAAGRRRLAEQAKDWARYVACVQGLLGPALGTS